MKYKFILMFLAITLLSPTLSFPAEKDYQKIWCDSMGGVREVVLPDKSRADCVIEKYEVGYAVEVEYARKWQEAIGQALYYSAVLKKFPGILIISAGDSDNKYIDRLMIVADKYNIKVWVIK